MWVFPEMYDYTFEIFEIKIFVIEIFEIKICVIEIFEIKIFEIEIFETKIFVIEIFEIKIFEIETIPRNVQIYQKISITTKYNIINFNLNIKYKKQNWRK